MILFVEKTRCFFLTVFFTFILPRFTTHGKITPSASNRSYVVSIDLGTYLLRDTWSENTSKFTPNQCEAWLI